MAFRFLFEYGSSWLPSLSILLIEMLCPFQASGLFLQPSVRSAYSSNPCIRALSDIWGY